MSAPTNLTLTPTVAESNSAAERATSDHRPREFFQALFETVLEEIDHNPDFAARLAKRLPDGVTMTVKPRKRRIEAPAELLEMDLKAMRAELGQVDFREKLAGFTNAELAAFIRARQLITGAISGKNKTQLVNAILRAAK